MKQMLEKLRVFIKRKARKAQKHKSRAQSMVEFAILLPVMIMLFSGMIEFGFMLNTYLSLLDATRSSAREYSNKTPFILDTVTNTITDDPSFYLQAALAVKNVLAPPSDPNARQIVLDPTRDDVLISVLSVSVDSSTHTITSIQRHPDGQSYYSLNQATLLPQYLTRTTQYQDTDIETYMTENGTPPVQTGILIVEVYYGYKSFLHLPWLEMFMSDDNPVMLHASTIMPLVSAKP